MKGLFKNNFYAVGSSLQATVIMSFVGIIIVAAASFFYPTNDFVISCVTSGMLGAFGALSGTAIQKDVNCKWNKFELTMPVSRKDVVSARYLSFLSYFLIGLFLAVLNVFLVYLLSGSMNLERVAYSFVFGMGFSLSIPTFLYPLVLVFGVDKNELLLMFSILLGLGLFFGSAVLSSLFLKGFEHANWMFRISYLIISFGLFVLSYLFSLFYYRKKEL